MHNDNQVTGGFLSAHDNHEKKVPIVPTFAFD